MWKQVRVFQFFIHFVTLLLLGFLYVEHRPQFYLVKQEYIYI